MTTLAWFILWIPFLTSVGITLFLRKNHRMASYVATIAMFTCFLLSLSLLPQCLDLKRQGLLPLESSLVWIAIGSLKIEIGILLNGLTLLMLLIVTGIGSLIFLYSVTYMKKDPSESRYFASLSLFAFSMLGIVVSNNLIQIFIFWELVGLSSYLLIGFWLEKPEASIAGKKAFLTTRVGDVGMMIGILMLFGLMTKNGFGTFNFLELEKNLAPALIPPGWMAAIALLLFLGVAGKSAQVPLHVWLPDAMEGPTPVSALIHAATMVAAGVFLLTRLDFLFASSMDASRLIAWIGGVTALIAATIAIVQNDIKKILAYSTLSQLGYMVMALGLGASDVGMFHLTTHAFFKAMLFLGAGSLIHAFHTQNIWEMKEKGLILKMPVTAISFLIGTFALMGIPPLSGFYSKEEILAAAHASGSSGLFVISMIVVFLTAFYMGRLISALFFAKSDPHHHSEHKIHESDWRMCLPLIVLAVFSVIGGFLPIRELIRTHEPGHAVHHDSSLLYMSLGLAAGAFLISLILHRFKPCGLFSLPGLKFPGKILEKKYFFDDLYDLFIKYVQDQIARVSDLFERFVVVEGGVNGTARLTRFFGDVFRNLQTGVVQFYALLFAGGLTFFIYLLLFKGLS